MPLKGSCLCGKVQVSVKDDALPLKPVVCRCTNCQQTAGSPYSLVTIVPEDKVEITGETKASCLYGVDTDTTTTSGNNSKRHFCPECGSPVQTVSPTRAGLAIIKLGLFAKSDGWKDSIGTPVAQIFTRNQKPWESLIDGVPAVEGTM
ncbi:glutathione-dependent formaldehyde-activating gfa [Moesziomyces aphidis]|uniref:Glutathione-dependent formaldehyde-activating gfa n=1 Tax=Moesziomyces aphidis TaxID=84754 RepID=W3VNV5_MOEAP|nr:glutathione-dependent formaldehyde-activating gfa [Moesziomyces aphidis]